MIIGYHTIFSAYGFWLPNDPRGSWSEYVGAWNLFRFGHATKTDAHQSVANKKHDRHKRYQAKSSLKYPPVSFSGLQARAIGRGFSEAAKSSGYHIYACAILPKHIHLVIGKHKHSIGQIVGQLKGKATKRLIYENLHPFKNVVNCENEALPTPWARKSWNVYLDNPERLSLAIQYVLQNPIKEGKKQQNWSFVIP